MITHLDHLYSYLRDNNLETALKRLEAAGFIRVEKNMRHPAGHLNGFVKMTGTYLEFVSIVDEIEFEKDASPEDRLFRKHPQPFAAGAVCTDPQLIFERLSPIYSSLKPPYSRGETHNADSPILWTFCPLPSEATPGAEVFPLKYHSMSGKPYELTMGANSVFGITGLVLCSDQISERMDVWEKTLRSVSWNFKRTENEIEFGVQRLSWLTPAQYEARFLAPWVKLESKCGEISAIKLGVQSLETAKTCLESVGFNFGKISIGIVTIANIENNNIPRNNTIVVMGLLSAKSTIDLFF